MIVRGYGRASTDKQTLSTKQQESVVTAAFENRQRGNPAWREARWGGFFADNDTCRLTRFHQRENGSLLLANCQRGDVVIVSNFDRIFASVTDVCDTLESTQQRGWHLIILDMDIDTTTPLGEACFKLLAVIKELEVKERRRRNKAATEYRASVGLPIGPAPVGWKNIQVKENGQIRSYCVKDKRMRELGDFILALQVKEKLSVVNLCDRLNALDVRRPGGKKWKWRNLYDFLAKVRDGYPFSKRCHEPAPIPAHAEPVRVPTIGRADD